MSVNLAQRNFLASPRVHKIYLPLSLFHRISLVLVHSSRWICIPWISPQEVRVRLKTCIYWIISFNSTVTRRVDIELWSRSRLTQANVGLVDGHDNPRKIAKNKNKSIPSSFSVFRNR